MLIKTQIIVEVAIETQDIFIDKKNGTSLSISSKRITGLFVPAIFIA